MFTVSVVFLSYYDCIIESFVTTQSFLQFLKNKYGLLLEKFTSKLLRKYSLAPNRPCPQTVDGAIKT